MGNVGHLRVLTDDTTPQQSADLIQVYAACAAISSRVEPAGPEVFIDLSAPGCKGLWRHLLKQLETDGVPAVLGLATSKLVARLASNVAAARQETYYAVHPGQEAAFLSPLPIEQLWPASEDVRARLMQLGFRRIGQLRDIPLATLEQRFGRYGPQLRQWSLGVDPTVVAALYPPKVIDIHRTFNDNPLSMATGLPQAVAWAARQAATQLQEAGGACRQLELRLSDPTGRCYAQSRRFTHTPLAQAEPLRRAAQQLLEKAAPCELIAEIRLVASDLAPIPISQQALFVSTAARNQAKLADVVATIRARFGAAAVQKGAEITPPRRDRFLALLEHVWLG